MARCLRSRLGPARGEVASGTLLGSESNWVAVDPFFVALRFQAEATDGDVVVDCYGSLLYNIIESRQCASATFRSHATAT